MADEIVGAEVPVVPDPVIEEAPLTGDPQEGVDYEVVAEGRYRWIEDGRVTDIDGNEVDPDAPVVAAVVAEQPPEPAAVIPEPAKPVVQLPAPRTASEAANRPIYTREATKAAIYTDAILAEIGEVHYSDPAKAERMRADLAEQYQAAIGNIERHSLRVFDQELDDIAKDCPKSVAGLTRQIQRYKEQLTPEQRQQPGAADWAYRQAVADSLSQDRLAGEEIYLRSTTHQRAETPSPAPRRPPAPAVIPREERMPGAGSARRVPQPRRPAGVGGPDQNLRGYAQFQKQIHPDWTDEECLAVAKSSIEAEQNRRAPR